MTFTLILHEVFEKMVRKDTLTPQISILGVIFTRQSLLVTYCVILFLFQKLMSFKISK